MMYTHVTNYDFREAFRLAGRQENFSYVGLGVLFDYLEDFSEDIGEDMELDVIALCCQYSEAAPEELAQEYPDIATDIEATGDVEDVSDWAEALADYTTVCGLAKTPTLTPASYTCSVVFEVF